MSAHPLPNTRDGINLRKFIGATVVPTLLWVDWGAIFSVQLASEQAETK